MKRIFFIMYMLKCSLLFAQQPDANGLLKQIDDNMTSTNKVIVSRMVIHDRRGSRTIESKSYIEGVDKSFTEYLSPPREKGTKMLKLEDQLWTYSPGTDRIIRISGHMLRQSVMGSDMSYEDMMEDPELHHLYDAEIVGEENIDGRDCWILELKAKKQDVAYHSRKVWVDKERDLIMKENRYGRSGKLLKSTQIYDVVRQDDRWVPIKIVVKDELKHGQGTEFIVQEIRFDVDIPVHMFSKASLRR
ncbi:outer membrane lipoprotein-sorting protein [candidate division KSB1 bacterium]|nr:outer membrane lipoprotein-sorting protein [candidate division KSB1 bacterium]